MRLEGWEVSATGEVFQTPVSLYSWLTLPHNFNSVGSERGPEIGNKFLKEYLFIFGCKEVLVSVYGIFVAVQA